jgi:hypothetical protein
MTQYVKALQEMANNATGADNFKEALGELRQIGQTIREMDQALTQAIYQYKYGQGGSGQGSGNGQYGSNN